MATNMEEIMVFLTCPAPKIAKAGVDIVRRLSGSEDGVQYLAKCAAIVLPPLSRLLTAKKELSEPAAEALVNLSENWILAVKMVRMGMVRKATDILYGRDSGIRRPLVTLLVNLTKLDAGIASILFHVGELVYLFCTRPSSKTSDDPFENVGSILVTISRQDAGRKILLPPKGQLLKGIAMKFNSSNPLRKKVIVEIIRNCCFDVEGELHSLLLISEFLWPALLLPLAGSRIYNEQDVSKMPPELGSALSIEHEPVTDPEIRILALEAIYLIASQEAGRRALWSVNGPRILRVGYKAEENVQVMQAYERVSSLIQNSGVGELSTPTLNRQRIQLDMQMLVMKQSRYEGCSQHVI
ncbi:hypothetical protein CJ030_MR7G025638 [Morella rubra]|uniref:Protein HGH1 homolog n=1 Tax=Morella rubra TaxID=262757 RepID=A0A6A1V0W9_9ROSI|nr:hypothetical protein CJ030_MR7G025638 [Morella rubra]